MYMDHLYIDPHPYSMNHTLPALPISWRRSLSRNFIRYFDLGFRTLIISSVSATTAGLILIEFCKFVEFGPIHIVVMMGPQQ